MNIAFVACNQDPSRFLEDPSFIYRCQNPSLALAEADHRVSLLHVREFDAREGYDLIVVHRPRCSWRFRFAFRAMRRSGATLVADVDDLIFDEGYARYSPAVRNGILSEAAVSAQFRSNRRALERFDQFSVSTTALADQVRERFPNGTPIHVPNCVHHSWLSLPPRGNEEEGPRTLTYFPGTRSHDRDFQMIEPAIAEFLDQEPEVRLEITGHLNTTIRARPGQLVQMERQPFPDYVERVRRSWVNLSPLEETPFNACKSALKVVEAGFWGAPTLTSPTADAERLTDAGAILCRDGGDWLHQLNTLTDPEHLRQHTDGLRERTLARADIRTVSLQFLEAVAAS